MNSCVFTSLKFIVVLKAVITKFTEVYMVLLYINSRVFLISGDLHASERALKGLALRFQGRVNRLGRSDAVRFQYLQAIYDN